MSGNPDLTLPYWDWTTARTSAHPGWPFTNDFLGGFGNAGPGATTGFVTSGPFANPATWRMNIRRIGDAGSHVEAVVGRPRRERAAGAGRRALRLRHRRAGGRTFPTIYDAVPWNDATQATQPTEAQILASFRKYLERVLHDGVHVWIGDAWEFNAEGNPGDGGHMTFPSVAVNDPVFWLHHCNVDRLWSDLAAQGGHPRLPAPGCGHRHRRPQRRRQHGEPREPGVVQHHADPRPNDVQDHQALNHWYHSDLPEVTLDTPSVAYGPVPELLTTYMPVRFWRGPADRCRSRSPT